MYTRKLTVWPVFLGILLVAVSACAASIDASKTRTRAVIQQGGIVPAEELRVSQQPCWQTTDAKSQAPLRDNPPRPRARRSQGLASLLRSEVRSAAGGWLPTYEEGVTRACD